LISSDNKDFNVDEIHKSEENGMYYFHYWSFNWCYLRKVASERCIVKSDVEDRWSNLLI
jgi:hypothetical protein